MYLSICHYASLYMSSAYLSNFSICLPFNLSVCLFISWMFLYYYEPVCLFAICLPVFLAIYAFACLVIYLLICLHICLSMSVYIFLFLISPLSVCVYLSHGLFVYLSIYMSDCLPVALSTISVYLRVCLSLSFSLSVPFIYLSIYSTYITNGELKYFLNSFPYIHFKKSYTFFNKYSISLIYRE